MNKLFIILGVIFLFLILTGVSLIGYFAFAGSRLDASSKAYVDKNIPIIITNWSKIDFEQQTSPEFRKKVSDDQIAQLFAMLPYKLGAFRSYEGCKGQANINVSTKGGELITASYVAYATFQHGKAEIQVKLIQEEANWKILYFYVNMKPLK